MLYVNIIKFVLLDIFGRFQLQIHSYMLIPYPTIYHMSCGFNNHILSIATSSWLNSVYYMLTFYIENHNSIAMVLCKHYITSCNLRVLPVGTNY
mgnify:FL=1